MTRPRVAVGRLDGGGARAAVGVGGVARARARRAALPRRTTEPSSALETDLLQLAVERTPGQKVWLFDDYLKHVDAHGEHPVLVGCRAAFEAVVEGQEK